MGGRNYCRDSVHWITCSSSGIVWITFVLVPETLNSRTQNGILQWVQSNYLPLLRPVEGLIRLWPLLLYNQWTVVILSDVKLWTDICEPFPYRYNCASFLPSCVMCFVLSLSTCLQLTWVLLCHFFWLYCTCASGSLSLSLMQQEVVPVVVKQSTLIWPVSPDTIGAVIVTTTWLLRSV